VRYFYDLEPEWVISAYEKNGREYREIAVLFEGPLMPVEAFEMMAQFCNAVPMWQAVQHALDLEKANPEASTPSYEVRLISKASKRVLVTVLWESSAIDLCKEDYKSRNLKTYRLLAEIDLAEDEDIDEVNLSALSLAGNFRVLDMMDLDEVELEDTDREEQ